MSVCLPILVGLMDDDFFALKWNAHLLARDLRTRVLIEAENPDELLNFLKNCRGINVILLDVEYNINHLQLTNLIQSIRQLQPKTSILCLSQYGKLGHLVTAITSGTRGFLLKSEVRMAIGSAIVQSLQVDFLVTPGIVPLLQNGIGPPDGHVSTINPWLPDPSLTPKLHQVFTLRVLYGMTSPLAAREMHLAPATVEKYIQYAYQKLSSHWGDEAYLAGVDLSDHHPEVQAFHRFTLPPRVDQELLNRVSQGNDKVSPK